ncbi:sigma-54 dependent transcriptional regulator [Palleronia sp. LCG004]|uniref:sigma-54-dependent transcriptional regulator n=1 Tax=Palleronia sp. LCG004 TaxID=3079304 RepID=UPI002943D3A9|nr:sigma-54 dependent transcriptional regulator [Palleronia sp. LCG004]WOI58037.1 sigma-54 dependent transcriptional regulator [Palleronia sp. LCG004]
MTDVILVDDEEDIRISVAESLELSGYKVMAFARAERALDRIGPGFGGIVVSDIRMPRMDGLAFLKAALARDPDVPVVLMTGYGDVPMAVEALGQGAYDFIEKPFAIERLVGAIERGLEKRRLRSEIEALRSTAFHLGDDPVATAIPGQSPQIVSLRARVRAVAASALDALIVGETGTGKEHVARVIHELSCGAGKPFVALNLAALPAEHLESELFGHVAGAFPGAMRTRIGRLEHARGGTVYLDQIEATSLAIQLKLLRVIEERRIVPLGATDPVDLSVRFVASSRTPLEPLVAAGTFRDDLLYRIAPVTLTLPPLVARPGDVPKLYQTFLIEAAERLSRPLPEVTPDRAMALLRREWPGNLRELQSAAELHVLGLDIEADAGTETKGTLHERVDRFERDLIASTLASNGGSLKSTYESLGLGRKTLYEKMHKHGIRREDFTD